MLRYTSLLMFVAAFILSATVFFSCSKQNDLPGADTSTPSVQKMESDDDDSDVIDDLMVDGEVFGDVTDYCLYTVTRSNGANGGNAIVVGDILCYNCPDRGFCAGVNNIVRRIRATYGDGTTEIYTVVITGRGGDCTECPAGGKHVNGSI